MEVLELCDLCEIDWTDQTIIWKGKEYKVFNRITKSSEETVFFDENNNEVVTVYCPSGIIILEENEIGFEIMEVVR